MKPRNDAPVAANDVISENNATWKAFFAPAASPIPTEDTDLTIPAGYLLLNDRNARATAGDELANINDANPFVSAVAGVSALGGTVSLVGTTITYRAPANAYGLDTFVYTITDAGINEDINGNRIVPTAPLTHTATVTILVKPVNDVPLGVARSFQLTEYQELENVTGNTNPVAPTEGVGFRTITAADLLRVGQSNPARESTFSTGANSAYDEHEQSLRVVAFGLPGAASPAIDAALLTYDAFGQASATLTTANGTLQIQFAKDATGTGALTSLVYTPNTDYNRLTPFNVNDQFTYIVEDYGPVTVPGGPTVGEPGVTDENNPVTAHGSRRAAPATVTLTVLQANDVPIFPVFSTVNLTEDESADNVAVTRDIYVGSNIEIYAASPTTALDELIRQNVTITFAAVNVPAGMFAATPTLTRDGILTLRPNPDVFGFAVYDVTVTDNGRDAANAPDPRSVTRRMTINIVPVNDVPVTQNRSFTISEVEEFANGTGAATGNVAVLPITAGDLLQLSGGAASARESDFANGTPNIYDESEQDLRVVEFTITLSDGSTRVVTKADSDTVFTSINGGTLKFSFDGTGAFTTGEYRPAVDYNRLTPFNPTELFTYVVEDFGAVTIPGSDFVNGGAATKTDFTVDGTVLVSTTARSPRL